MSFTEMPAALLMDLSSVSVIKKRNSLRARVGRARGQERFVPLMRFIRWCCKHFLTTRDIEAGAHS